MDTPDDFENNQNGDPNSFMQALNINNMVPSSPAPLAPRSPAPLAATGHPHPQLVQGPPPGINGVVYMMPVFIGIMPVTTPVNVSRVPEVTPVPAVALGQPAGYALAPQHFAAKPPVPVWGKSPGPDLEEVLAAMDSSSSAPSQSSTPPPPRRRVSGKRAPHSLWGTAKRSRADDVWAAAARFCVASPAAGAVAVASAAAAAGAPAPSEAGSSQSGRRPAPEATDDVWEFRQMKRKAALVTVKESPEYKRVHRPDLDHVGEPAPKTPDPMNRGISKRQWEDDVRKWRAALRERAGP